MLNPKPSLHIVIPTKGRADWRKQTTLSALLAAGKRVTLVVNYDEAKPYRALLCDRGRGSPGGLVKIAKCPITAINNIGSVRYWITRKLFRNERILMLDDDLSFYYRPDMHAPYLLPAGPMDIRKMLLYMDIQLTPECPMVGLSSRVGNHEISTPVKYNTRTNCATALDLSVLREANLRYRKLADYEDIDFTLRLLQSGRTNAVLYNYCWATTRRKNKLTMAMRVAAKELLELHPDLVTLQKGSPRIAWSKIHENSDTQPQ
jgi:TET-associated glycosyltransferase-like protein